MAIWLSLFFYVLLLSISGMRLNTRARGIQPGSHEKRANFFSHIDIDCWKQLILCDFTLVGLCLILVFNEQGRSQRSWLNLYAQQPFHCNNRSVSNANANGWSSKYSEQRKIVDVDNATGIKCLQHQILPQMTTLASRDCLPWHMRHCLFTHGEQMWNQLDNLFIKH